MSYFDTNFVKLTSSRTNLFVSIILGSIINDTIYVLETGHKSDTFVQQSAKLAQIGPTLTPIQLSLHCLFCM